MLNQHFSVDFSYQSEITDISHYFCNGDNGNTKKYDVVLTQPAASDYYKGIDKTSLANYGALEYYSLRSLDFLTKGGYLCVFTHPRKFSILNGNRKLINEATLVEEIINKDKFDEYGCIIYKKK
jgi:hypothetical protein